MRDGLGRVLVGVLQRGQLGGSLARRVLTARPALLAGPLAAALALLAPAASRPVRADEVLLTDGTELEGEVVDDAGPVVRVAVRRGADRVVIEVPRAAIRRIRRLAGDHARLAAEAEAALLAGDVAAAVSALTPLAAARPDDPRAQRELGFALLLDGRLEAAEAALGRACALDPIDLEAHLQRAHALERLGRRDAAIDAWRRATVLGSRHVQAWRALARLLLERGGPRDREAALRALDLAARAAPDHEGLALDRAAALAPDLARAPLPPPGVVPGDGPAAADARAVLAELLARRPASAEAARALARLEAQRGAFAAARDRAAATAARSDVGPEARAALAADAARYAWLADGAATLAPPDLDAGLDAVDLEWAERGLSLLLEREAALVGEDDGRLLLARARVRLRAGQLAGAAEDLERAALAGPPAVTGDALLLQEAGVALRAGAPLAPGAAPAKAARLVALLPWEAQAHAAHAAALERDGQPADAARAWLRAAARAPDPTAQARYEAAAEAARADAERRRRTAGT